MLGKMRRNYSRGISRLKVRAGVARQWQRHHRFFGTNSISAFHRPVHCTVTHWPGWLVLLVHIDRQCILYVNYIVLYVNHIDIGV